MSRGGVGEDEQLYVGTGEKVSGRGVRRHAGGDHRAASGIEIRHGNEGNGVCLCERWHVAALRQPPTADQAHADGAGHTFAIADPPTSPATTESASVSFAIHSA